MSEGADRAARATADGGGEEEATFSAGGHVFELSRLGGDWPDAATLAGWVGPALEAAAARAGAGGCSTVALVFADDAAVRVLNATWRSKDAPTNVLSFPAADTNIFSEERHLGDVVLAAETVAAEAEAQGKSLRDHVIHLVLHGFLHLRGYDHGDDAAAEAMEGLEREALSAVGIADPYGDG